MSSSFLFFPCTTALLLVCVSSVTACEAKYSDDGKGVLLHELLSQPFRVSLLRDGEGLPRTYVAATPAAKEQSFVGQEEWWPWYEDVGFALAPDEANPYEDEYHASGLRVNKPKHNLISPIFSHPQRRKQPAAEEAQQQQGKDVVEPPRSENPKDLPERFTLKVGIGKYDGLDLARARRVKRETIKATSHLSNSRYGEIRDTSLIVRLYDDEFSANARSSSSSSRPVLSLSTLDPYLPFTMALLGGRIGAVTQAQRYESTGHSELEGLMSADKKFWDCLRGVIKVSSTSNGSIKHIEQEELEKDNVHGAKHQQNDDDDLIHGTFTLTFLNRQEFTLKLKALPAPNTDGESEAFENCVVFYGFATPPILPSRATVYSTISAMLGLHGGGASSLLSSTAPAVLASDIPTVDTQLSRKVPTDGSSMLLLSSVLRGIYQTLFFDGRVSKTASQRQAEQRRDHSVFAGVGLEKVPDCAALMDTLSAGASFFQTNGPDNGQAQGHQRADPHTYAQPLPAAYFPTMIDRAFVFAVRALATPFACSLPQAGDQKSEEVTAGRNKKVAGAKLEQRVTEEEAEEEARLLLRSLSKLSSWCYDKWPLLFALSTLVALKILAGIIEWAKNRRVRREKEARERTQRESDERLALLLGEPLRFTKK